MAKGGALVLAYSVAFLGGLVYLLAMWKGR